MTDRLADIGARIHGVGQLGAVVNAMRGIAAARAQQARTQLASVDSYALTMALAIGRVLDRVPTALAGAPRKAAHPALVLFCAEQGFASAFSERVLAAVGADLKTSELFLVGTRGKMAIAEHGIVPGWTAPMPSHSASIPKLADAIATALYARIATGGIDQLDAVFSRWRPGHGADVTRQRLFPFDRAAFPRPHAHDLPLLDVAPDVLVRALTADYVHALLCAAALHAFSAENEARMEAMAAARNQVERQLASLRARQRMVRQEEITAEVIELAAGETATNGR